MINQMNPDQLWQAAQGRPQLERYANAAQQHPQFQRFMQGRRGNMPPPFQHGMQGPLSYGVQDPGPQGPPWANNIPQIPQPIRPPWATAQSGVPRVNELLAQALSYWR